MFKEIVFLLKNSNCFFKFQSNFMNQYFQKNPSKQFSFKGDDLNLVKGIFLKGDDLNCFKYYLSKEMILID
jgi:hypothetical protein